MAQSSQAPKLLMVDPEFFEIAYAINPHMSDAEGNLKTVDKARARAQWENLREQFLGVGAEVDTLSGAPELPDMVFAANQSWPFLDPKTGKKSVLLSQMRSDFRKPEVEYFESYFRQNGYEIYHLENKKISFEGNGDALVHPGRNAVWCGVGPRTEAEAYREIAARFGFRTHLLELKDPQFYHLDTCFSILSPETVAIVKGVFSAKDESLIRDQFSRVIEISAEEGTQFFSGNCFCFDGHHVFLQAGAKNFERDLQGAGFRPVPVDTSEYIKSGGSVFCMKMWLP